jgi:tyrosine-protein phosphatase YwqE
VAVLASTANYEVAVPMAILHFRCKERRRTVRVMLSVPLRVSGKTEIGEKFSVKALSHSVSLHGASIELDLEVVLGEILQLENEITREKVEGKVVSIRRSRDGKKYVAIEFISEDANFWHMAFPIPGARPLRRPISAKVSSL